MFRFVIMIAMLASCSSISFASDLTNTQWRPFNFTAEAVTGSLHITENQLIFSDREHLPIKAVGDRTTATYAFTNATNLKFNGGRALCSNGVNTGFLQFKIVKLEGQEALELRVFRGPTPPDTSEDIQRNLCSTYLYIR